MRVTVVHTTASAADIAGYRALVLVIGDTSMATVLPPSRHSVGGGPRARPAASTG